MQMTYYKFIRFSSINWTLFIDHDGLFEAIQHSWMESRDVATGGCGDVCVWGGGCDTPPIIQNVGQNGTNIFLKLKETFLLLGQNSRKSCSKHDAPPCISLYDVPDRKYD